MSEEAPSPFERGLANLGRKDSWDAIRHADGTLATTPIALCEVQGYVHAAYVARAHFASEAGDTATLERYRNKAHELRRRFNEDFWVEEHGWYALGLDADKRPIDALASNIGHCLWTGIVDPDRAAAVVQRLMSDELFSGWGIRTLATTMTAYNPVSYHNGSVWPHDNAICAAGLVRYGYVEEAHRIIGGQLAVAAHQHGRPPELFAGFARDTLATPAAYPTSCSPQAWASASPLLWLRTLLRLDPWAPHGQVSIEPAFPSWMGHLHVEGFAIADQRLTSMSTPSASRSPAADRSRSSPPLERRSPRWTAGRVSDTHLTSRAERGVHGASALVSRRGWGRSPLPPEGERALAEHVIARDSRPSPDGTEGTQPMAASGLRVGLIAPPWVPVPPVVYGGTELVIDLLARGLAAAGCDVVLFATGDSTCPVPLRWLYPKGLGTVVAPAGERAHVGRAYRELAGVDVIHDHTLAGPTLPELHRPGTPIVTTVHGEFIPRLRDLYASAAASHVAVVAISHAQRRSAPEVPVAAVIHHGIDVTSFPVGEGDGGYVLFLGRMNPDKGPHRAIDIARAAGKRIVLAAKMWEPDELRYFAEQVEPRLGHDAVFVGEVGSQRKLELLGGAEALVSPIRWNEPFGLVMIEALACGTPVLSFAEGAAPEIVDHGRTGFLCADEDDMVAAMSTVAAIDRAVCRAAAESRFSSARMVADHLALYARLLSDRAVIYLDERRAAGAPPSPRTDCDEAMLGRTRLSVG